MGRVVVTLLTALYRTAVLLGDILYLFFGAGDALLGTVHHGEAIV